MLAVSLPAQNPRMRPGHDLPDTSEQMSMCSGRKLCIKGRESAERNSTSTTQDHRSLNLRRSVSVASFIPRPSKSKADAPCARIRIDQIVIALSACGC